MGIVREKTVTTNNFETRRTSARLSESPASFAKAHSLSLPQSPATLPTMDTLANRITKGPIDKKTANAYNELRKTILELMDTIQRISQNHRDQSEKNEKELKTLTYEGADHQRSFGKNGLWFAGGSLATSFAGALVPAEYRDVVNVIASRCVPELGNAVGSSYQAKMQIANGLSSIILQKLSADTQSKQTDSQKMSDATNMLKEINELFRSAARAN